jgi:hypothetical protein
MPNADTGEPPEDFGRKIEGLFVVAGTVASRLGKTLLAILFYPKKIILQSTEITLTSDSEQYSSPVLFLTVVWLVYRAVVITAAVSKYRFFYPQESDPSVPKLFDSPMAIEEIVFSALPLMAGATIGAYCLARISAIEPAHRKSVFRVACYVVALFCIFIVLLNLITALTGTSKLELLAVAVALLYPSALLYWGLMKLNSSASPRRRVFARIVGLPSCCLYILLVITCGQSVVLARHLTSVGEEFMKLEGPVQAPTSPSPAIWVFTVVLHNDTSEGWELTRNSCRVPENSLGNIDLRLLAWAAANDPIMTIAPKERKWVRFQVEQTTALISVPVDDWVPVQCSVGEKMIRGHFELKRAAAANSSR